MKSHKRIIVFIFLLGYTMLLSYSMIWGFGRTAQPGYSYNLVPFLTMASYFPVRGMDSLINIIGNIAVFVPFGVLIPLAFRVGFRKMLGFFLTGLFLLEMIQLISRRGSLDVDDFMLNSIGVTLGYGLLGVVRKWRSG
ncbi:VanZ family protein [Paenibacillus lautus]|uniref:VanZ family protein n=1 Tax=Paenibacillus lautus TaxID=1401 RepID=UPI003D9A6560